MVRDRARGDRHKDCREPRPSGLHRSGSSHVRHVLFPRLLRQDRDRGFFTDSKALPSSRRPHFQNTQGEKQEQAISDEEGAGPYAMEDQGLDRRSAS
mgnify:CR=1 FL=1